MGLFERTVEQLHARYDATEKKVDRVLAVGGRRPA